jgi:hypothetical protein
VLWAERGPHTASRLVFSATGGRRPRPLVPLGVARHWLFDGGVACGAATARRDRLPPRSVSGFVAARLVRAPVRRVRQLQEQRQALQAAHPRAALAQDMRRHRL